MATFVASLRVISRSKGQSAVAASAYRAGNALHDQRTGALHDFSRRKGVESCINFAPVDAPAWALDIEALWNAAEAAEVRRNSRVARELIVALPHELSPNGRQDLAHGLAQALVERYSVAVSAAVHAPDARGDERNHHVHLLFSCRQIGPDGFGKKVRVLDDREQGPLEVEALRQLVADATNAALAKEGIGDRVDHRRLTVQAAEAEAAGDYDRAARLTREPSAKQGRAATAAWRRGEFVPVVDDNQRKQREHQKALASYLRQAHAEGRLMPASHDLRPPIRSDALPDRRPLPSLPWKPDLRVRATGPGAAALNAQAAAQAGQARRSKKVADDYLRGLEATSKEARRWLDEYAELTGRRHAMESWLVGTDDAEALRLVEKSVDALREMSELDASRRTAMRQAATAERARRAYQQAVDQHDEHKPPRWAMLRARQWEQVRRVKWAALRKAIADEQSRLAPVGEPHSHGLRRAHELRAELRKFEQTLRQIQAGPAPHQPPCEPRPQTLARPRP